MKLFHIHVHIHQGGHPKQDVFILNKIKELKGLLLSVNQTVQKILLKEKIMQNKFDEAFNELIAKVAAETAVTQSAVVLLKDLKTKLDDAIASGDLAKVRELSNQIGASTDALAAAVLENTPVVTEPPVAATAGEAASADASTAENGQ